VTENNANAFEACNPEMECSLTKYHVHI